MHYLVSCIFVHNYYFMNVVLDKSLNIHILFSAVYISFCAHYYNVIDYRQTFDENYGRFITWMKLIGTYHDVS